MISSTDTVIIGAGPYGLSISAHLSKAGVPHQILGQPMQAWRQFMPPGMLLRSEGFASNLSAPWDGYRLEDYCRHRGIAYKPRGMRMPLEVFAEYGLWFQSQLVGHLRPLEVIDMCREDGHFRLALSDGSSLAARRAVLSLGLRSFAQMPAALRGMSKPHVIHSGEFGSYEWARNKSVAIVGAGQSAVGLAALFNEIGAHVHLLVRGPELDWSDAPRPSRVSMPKMLKPDVGLGRGWPSNHPRDLLTSYLVSEHPWTFHMLGLKRRQWILETGWAPSGAWWLRDRVEGKTEISLRSEIRRAELQDDQVVMEVAVGNDKTRITADHVVVATGFKVDMARHPFLSRELVDALSLTDGSPNLTRHFETSVRDLYVVGPAAALSFGPALRFVHGAKYAAPHLAGHIGKRYEAETPQRATRPQGAAPELAEGHGGAGLRGQSVLQAAENSVE